MTVELTILIVITSASLITSLVGPLVTGLIELTKRVEKSSCCGSSVELTKINDVKQELEHVKSQHAIEIGDKKEQLDRLMELLDKQN